MYSKLFFEPATTNTQAEPMASVTISDTFDYAGASLYTSSDQESASLQTVLVLDIAASQPEVVRIAGLPISHCWQKNL